MILNERNLGKDHPNTITSYSNLANVLSVLGDFHEAKKLLEKAIISDEENFGKDHANTIVNYNNLALVLKDLGDYDKAKELLEIAMAFNKKSIW
jgi:tetratricopeptide (TPR) repeat protein